MIIGSLNIKFHLININTNDSYLVQYSWNNRTEKGDSNLVEWNIQINQIGYEEPQKWGKSALQEFTWSIYLVMCEKVNSYLFLAINNTNCDHQCIILIVLWNQQGPSNNVMFGRKQCKTFVIHLFKRTSLFDHFSWSLRDFISTHSMPLVSFCIPWIHQPI